MLNIEFFIHNNIKEDNKYYYIPVSVINVNFYCEVIKNYLKYNNWKYISNAKTKIPGIKNKRCFRILKSEYNIPLQTTTNQNSNNESLSKTAENKGFEAKNYQTVNLHFDENSTESITQHQNVEELLNFDEFFQEFNNQNFDFDIG